MIEMRTKDKIESTKEITEINKSLDEILTIGQEKGFAYIPKKWNQHQYETQTIGKNGQIPPRALNGHANGIPVKSNNGFIVRVGKTSLDALKFD